MQRHLAALSTPATAGQLLTAKGVRYHSTTANRQLGSRRHYSICNSVPVTMKAAVIRETGDASVMKIEKDYPVPQIADGQVLVHNQYAGINFIDTYHRSGLYARELPFVGGQEGGGTIAATTPKAEAMGLKVGDRVCYSILQTYSEYSAVPAAKILPVPDNVPLDVATACVVQGLTAHYLVTSAHAGLIQPGEWMLIHATGGGTTQWAAQMAKICGYKVIGTVARGKADVALATGADETIIVEDTPGAAFEDYTTGDVTKRVMEITDGAGAKCVIDGVGLATTDISIDCLAQRGIFVSFGNASGAVPPVAPLRFIGKSAFLTRPKLLDYTRNRTELLNRANEIFEWVGDGKLKVSVDQMFPLEDAVEGHRYLEAGKSTGKVLYEICPE